MTSTLLGVLAVASIFALDVPSAFGMTYTKPGPVSVDANHITRMTFEVESIGIRPPLLVLQFVSIAVWCFVARWWILKPKADDA